MMRTQNGSAIDFFLNGFSSLRGFKKKRPTEIYKLLEIDFPILFALRYGNALYLCYVLRFNKGKNISLIIAKSSYNTLLRIVTQQCSIYDGINKKNLGYVCGGFNKRVFWKYFTTDAKRLQYFLPEDDYFLTEIIPNKVDLVRLAKILKRRLRFEDRLFRQARKEVVRDVNIVAVRQKGIALQKKKGLRFKGNNPNHFLQIGFVKQKQHEKVGFQIPFSTLKLKKTLNNNRYITVGGVNFYDEDNS